MWLEQFIRCREQKLPAFPPLASSRSDRTKRNYFFASCSPLLASCFPLPAPCFPLLCLSRFSYSRFTVPIPSPLSPQSSVLSPAPSVFLVFPIHDSPSLSPPHSVLSPQSSVLLPLSFPFFLFTIHRPYPLPTQSSVLSPAPFDYRCQL
jgi:hypothetical protein